MQKIVLPLAAFLLLVVTGSAQTGKRSLLSLSAGPSFPMGNFSKKSIHDPSAGLANTGVQVSVSYQYKTSAHFGFIATLKGIYHGTDGRSLANQFNQENFSSFGFSGAIPPDPPSPSGRPDFRNWNFKNKPWIATGLQGGGYGEVSLNKKSGLSLLVKAMIGPLYAQSPGLQGESRTDTAMASIRQTRKSAWGLSYTFGAGLVYYPVSHRIGLTLQVDYLTTSSLTFENVKTTIHGVKQPGGTDPSQAFSATTTGNGKQVIQAVQIGVGVSVRL